MSTPAHPDEALREELVAYLDGELSVGESESIESRIGQDDRAREEMQRLDRVWNALDKLPQVVVGDNFTKTTIEMAAVEAKKELLAETALLPVKKQRRWMKLVGMTVAAALVGFVTLRLLTPNPNRELYNNLPAIMQMDAYNEVGDLEFLKQLHASCGTWLAEEWGDEIVEEATALNELTTASYGDRADYVEQLSDDRRAELASQHQRYKSLSLSVRNDLAGWHQSLASQPDSDDLQQTMLAYYAWLSQVDEADQVRLRQLDSAERVKRISELHKQSVKQDRYSLSPAEAAALRKALSDLVTDPEVTKRYNDLMAVIDESIGKPLPPKLKESMRRLRSASPEMTMRMVIVATGRTRVSFAPPTFEAYRSAIEERLIDSLDDETATRLSQMDDGFRKAFLAKWVIESAKLKSSKPDTAALAEYFATGNLSEEDKAWLLSLPNDEMMKQLEKRYIDEYFGGDQEEVSPQIRDLWQESDRWRNRGRGLFGRPEDGGPPPNDRGPGPDDRGGMRPDDRRPPPGERGPRPGGPGGFERRGPEEGGPPGGPRRGPGFGPRPSRSEGL